MILPEDVEFVAAGDDRRRLVLDDADASGERPSRHDFRTSTPTGEARMVDVSDKPVTARTATAAGRVRLSAGVRGRAAGRVRAQG